MVSDTGLPFVSENQPEGSLLLSACSPTVLCGGGGRGRTLREQRRAGWAWPSTECPHPTSEASACPLPSAWELWPLPIAGACCHPGPSPCHLSPGPWQYPPPAPSGTPCLRMVAPAWFQTPQLRERPYSLATSRSRACMGAWDIGEASRLGGDCGQPVSSRPAGRARLCCLLRYGGGLAGLSPLAMCERKT